MQCGMLGLGRMGMNMARRLLQAKHEVVVYNRSQDKVELMVKEGAKGAGSLKEFVQKLKTPRVLWLMLPTGDVLNQHIEELIPLLAPGDLIVEGGNSFYKDDIKRAAVLKSKKINYMDAGVSGGIWGLKIGYCLMLGGEKADFDGITPILKDLAPPNGYLHCGPHGAGHYVKMIHNGIEYGMMQAYGEGFELLRAAPFPIPLDRVAVLWNQGSVVRSWLLELAAEALQGNADLSGVSGYVEDSGEGRWTVQQAVESGVAAPVITMALYERFLSRQKDAFSNKVLAALRNKFGGHEIVKGGAEPSSEAGAGAFKPARGENKK